MVMQDQAWNGFAAGEWQRSIDVRSFIQKNLSLIHISEPTRH